MAENNTAPKKQEEKKPRAPRRSRIETLQEELEKAKAREKERNDKVKAQLEEQLTKAKARLARAQAQVNDLEDRISDLNEPADEE